MQQFGSPTWTNKDIRDMDARLDRWTLQPHPFLFLVWSVKDVTNTNRAVAAKELLVQPLSLCPVSAEPGRLIYKFIP